MMQNKLKISIFNKQYSLVTDEQEDLVCKAIERIDDLVKDKDALSQGELAIITALELAIELEKANKQLDNCAARIKQLLHIADAS